MTRMRTRLVVALFALTVMAFPGWSSDYGRLVKSSVFPGMGQLGDGQTIKGLSFMAGEVFLLTATFNQLSRSLAYAAETRRFKIKSEFGGEYSDLVEIHAKWKRYYDDSEKARNLTILYGGLAAVCWGLNIADALLFPPAVSTDEASILRDAASKTTLSFAGNQGRVIFTTDF